MTDTMTPEQAAEEYVLSVMEDFPGELIEVGKPDLKVQARDLINLARNAYLDGKAEERERIWEGVKGSQTIAEFFELQKLAGGVRISELRQIIFGGGDEK